MPPHNRDSDEIPVSDSRALLRAIKAMLGDVVAPLRDDIRKIGAQMEAMQEKINRHETEIAILKKREEWERDSAALPIVKAAASPKPRKYLADHLTPESVRWLSLAAVILALAVLAFAMGGQGILDLVGLLPGSGP